MSEVEKRNLKKQIWQVEDLVKELKFALDMAETTLKNLKTLGGENIEK